METRFGQRLCDDMPACHTGIPNVKGWCLINYGLIPILSWGIQQCESLVKQATYRVTCTKVFSLKHCISVERY